MDRARLVNRVALFGPLLGFGIIAAATLVSYSLMRATPSQAAMIILTQSGMLILIAWMVADARQRRCVPCHEFGFLLAVFFPVSLIWYAFWTRGRKGFILLVALIGLILGPVLFAVCALIGWVVFLTAR